MMKIQPFTQNDFETYLAKALPHLAEEIAQARGISQEAGMSVAQNSFSNLFPKGEVNAKDQYIGFLVEGADKVGIIHFGVRKDPNSSPDVYLWDVEIFKPYRRNGFGKTAMRLLESQVRDLGLNRISLNVFGHNKMARALYEDLGYHTRSLSMTKDV